MFQVGDLVELNDHPENSMKYFSDWFKTKYNFPVVVERIDIPFVRVRNKYGDLEGWFIYRFNLAAPKKIYEYEELI
jgi:hypothetical protein